MIIIKTIIQAIIIVICCYYFCVREKLNVEIRASIIDTFFVISPFFQ